MKILIVEDEDPKCNKILKCLRGISMLEGCSIDVARSVRSSLDLIESNAYDAHPYDLILLDMSLPTFDISEDEQGGRPQGFGGVEVMRDMFNLEIPNPVIVVTAYEYFSDEHDEEERGKESTLAELEESLAAEFPEFFVGLVKYETYSEEWRSDLIQVVEKVMNS